MCAYLEGHRLFVLVYHSVGYFYLIVYKLVSKIEFEVERIYLLCFIIGTSSVCNACICNVNTFHGVTSYKAVNHKVIVLTVNCALIVMESSANGEANGRYIIPPIGIAVKEVFSACGLFDE